MVPRPAGRSERETVGWREWVSLPHLDTPWIKAKIDTGARSSALHAFGLERFEREGEPWVRFEIHPWQRSSEDAVAVEAPVTNILVVRSSNGAMEERPVIATTIRIGEREVPVGMTLTRRDEMGFRLLIGRQTLRGHFVVDPDRSFISGRPPRDVLRANRGRRRR
jgi:hypothetical protein